MSKETTLTLKEYEGLVPEGEKASVYLKLIKEQIVGSDLDTANLKLFLYTCKRTGLDPLVGQIYAVPRWDTKLGRNKMSIQTGIDGFRLVAQRTGAYAGQDDVVFEEKGDLPTKATVTVYKIVKGTRVPFTATARWAEYVQSYKDKKTGELKPSMMWKKMPFTMLGKCAESLALRKAFPNELSGIYTSDEMPHEAPAVDLPTPERFDKEAPEAPVIDAKEIKDKEVKKGDKKPKKVAKKTKKVVAESPSEARKKLAKEKTDGNKSGKTK